MEQLDGRTAVVTGGGNGIGLADQGVIRGRAEAQPADSSPAGHPVVTRR